jgi:glycosyltransferase involved in cell wall biosynthesis
MSVPPGRWPELTSVVLPIHDQADHIAGVVRGYLASLEGLGFPVEVVLVTNACRDDSPAVCDALAAEDPRIRHLPIEARGWGAAVRAGLEASEGDLLCYTNSARTTPEILTLLLVYAGVYPNVVVKANRRIRDSRRRRLGSLLYNLECRSLFDLSVWDINGTPKVFPRSFDKLLRLTRDDDLIDAEFAAICRRESYPMLEVPIFSSRRHGGKSTTNYGSAWKMYVGAYRLWQERR